MQQSSLGNFGVKPKKKKRPPNQTTAGKVKIPSKQRTTKDYVQTDIIIDESYHMRKRQQQLSLDYRHEMKQLACGLHFGCAEVFYYRGHWFAWGDMTHCHVFCIIQNFKRLKEIAIKLNLKKMGKAYDSDVYLQKEGFTQKQWKSMLWDLKIMYKEPLYNIDNVYELKECKFPTDIKNPYDPSKPQL